MLIDEEIKLSIEFLLLFSVRFIINVRAVGQRVCLQGSESGHILDDHKTELITSLVEQGGLDFDLCGEVSIEILMYNKEYSD